MEITLISNWVHLPLLPLGRQNGPVSFAVNWHLVCVTCLRPVGCEHQWHMFLPSLPSFFSFLPHLHLLKTKRMSTKEKLMDPCISLWKTFDWILWSLPWYNDCNLEVVCCNISHPHVCHMWVSGIYSTFTHITFCCTLLPLFLEFSCTEIPHIHIFTHTDPGIWDSVNGPCRSLVSYYRKHDPMPPWTATKISSLFTLP